MEGDLEFALSNYRGEVFREWLTALWAQGKWAGAAGGALRERLGSSWQGRPGLADNGYAADKLLEAAERAGWIVRGRWAPTPSQAAFIGLEGRRFTKGQPSYSYANEHLWMIADGNAEVRAWLADGKVGGRE